MEETQVTPRETPPSRAKAWYDKLLEQPLLLAILVTVFVLLLLLICAVLFYIFFYTRPVGPVPTSTAAVSFVTQTPGGPLTRPLPGSAAIDLLSVPGNSGTLITVTGSGWAPNDTVNVQVIDPTGAQGVAPLMTNSLVTGDGSFIASFLLPAGSGWTDLTTVRVVATSTESGASLTGEFPLIETEPLLTPTVPLIVVPTILPITPPPTNTPANGLGPTPTTDVIPTIGDWQAEYYNNPTLSGAPALVRNEAGLDFNWGVEAPAANLPVDNFSARWYRTYDLEAGLYIFTVEADDGIRLWIDNDLIINEWFSTSPRSISVEYPIEFSGQHEVLLEYADFSGTAFVRFRWERVAAPPPLPGPPAAYWRAAFWPNVNLFGDPLLVRDDGSINFDWGLGAPGPGLPVDTFSARWVRLVNFEPASYRFTVRVDDGARLFVDNQLIIDEWRDGLFREVSRDYALSAGLKEVRVEYYERGGEAEIEVFWSKSTFSTPTYTPTPFYPDWRGDYWANPTLSGAPALTRNDGTIDFNWAFSSPDSAIPADDFSARWTRTVNFAGGLYRFTAEFDDGIRVFIDNSLILSEWTNGPGSARTRTVDVNLSGPHQVRVEYYESIGSAEVDLDWQLLPPTATPIGTVSPTATLTQTPMVTPTSSQTPTLTPSATGAPTVTVSPTVIITSTPTLTPTGTLTPTATATP